MVLMMGKERIGRGKQGHCLMEKIVRMMKRLRSKKGCPWDRKQTLRSLRRCVLEEAHEVVDAIDSNLSERIAEEIGDMLCVVALVITIGEEKGLFKKKLVIDRAVRKMKSRHPHVFGREKARTAEDALRVFQRVKELERSLKKESLFADLGTSLPALMAAEKIQRKVARVGFDWPHAGGAFKKMEEELAELKRALRAKQRKEIREEIGDFLFSAVNFARKIGVEPETALLATNLKFRKRFERLEQSLGKEGLRLAHPSLSLKKMDLLWDRVKEEERK